MTALPAIYSCIIRAFVMICLSRRVRPADPSFHTLCVRSRAVLASPRGSYLVEGKTDAAFIVSHRCARGHTPRNGQRLPELF